MHSTTYQYINFVTMNVHRGDMLCVMLLTRQGLHVHVQDNWYCIQRYKFHNSFSIHQLLFFQIVRPGDTSCSQFPVNPPRNQTNDPYFIRDDVKLWQAIVLLLCFGAFALFICLIHRLIRLVALNCYLACLPLWIRLTTSWHVMTCHQMSPC